MGINDQGVMIGNEAVFTTSKGKKIERLTGMDMLRLALERSADAKSALNLLIELLTSYGQGGNCGFDKPFYYDNSFLVADRTQAFLLETCGKDWVTKEIATHGNISNRLSVNQGVLHSSKADFLNFAKKNSEPVFTFFSGSSLRQHHADDCLSATTVFDAASMMAVLQSHRC